MVLVVLSKVMNIVCEMGVCLIFMNCFLLWLMKLGLVVVL